MKAWWLGLGLAALAGTAGCMTPPKASTVWVNPLTQMESMLPAVPADNNYILYRMQYGQLAIDLGSDALARPRLKEAFEQLGAERDNTAAALTTEQLKYYKGETYERAMLCCHLGMLEYEAGQYNNARIYLMRALAADAASVVKQDTPQVYGDDFALAYFWLGKTFAKLGDADQCRIALQKAAVRSERADAAKEAEQDRKMCEVLAQRRIEGEAWAWKTFGDPKNPKLFIEGLTNLTEVSQTAVTPPAKLPGAAASSPIVRVTDNPAEFFTPAYQAETNMTCLIEVGRCPQKYLTGISGERTEFMRVPTYVSAIRVYVDGHDAGGAIELLDFWHQAATQDRIFEKDAAQAAKGVLKFILSQTSYASYAASYWNVSGDLRQWSILPGKVYVFAAKLTPGLHTIRVEMFDLCGRSLPRLTNTYYGRMAPASGEACYMLRPVFDGDNKFPTELIQKALEAGVTPGYGLSY